MSYDLTLCVVSDPMVSLILDIGCTLLSGAVGPGTYKQMRLRAVDRRSCRELTAVVGLGGLSDGS